MNQTISPSEFVALINQTLEFAYPEVSIEGEVTNFKISKNRWVYFDIQDKTARVRCFGTVYMLPGPVEDGMVVRITAMPRLHSQFGFSLNLNLLQFSGEGTIKKAADLLMRKLEKEGLFAADRKRPVPYPPATIALVTSAESAAYHDFIKVLGARYGGVSIELIDVAVQGESAPGQIVRAIDVFNGRPDLADVLVVIRGGGSSDDLQAFSSEQVTRAVAASRIPTVVAIGHEVDVSLAELAADLRASTPSNAAELLVPDRKALLQNLRSYADSLDLAVADALQNVYQATQDAASLLADVPVTALDTMRSTLDSDFRTLEALSPKATLRRGFAIVRSKGKPVRSTSGVSAGNAVDIELTDGAIKARVE